MNSNKKNTSHLNFLYQKARKISFYQKKYRNLKLPKKIASKKDFQKLPIIYRKDFFNQQISKETVFLKKSRRDAYGNEPKMPILFKDYYRFIDFEKERFKKMGVKAGDRCSVVDFTFNEAAVMMQALINLKTTYVVLEGNLEEICRDIICKKVKVIFTHPRMLKLIADHLKKEKSKLFLKLIIVSGEPIANFDLLKKEVKSFLRVKLIDTIGTRELGGYACQCSKQKHFHFLDGLFTEVINPKTKKPSRKGELIITPLWRQEFPLIRFSTGDDICLKKGPSICSKKSEYVFDGVEKRIKDDKKIGSAMYPLQKVFHQTKEGYLYQYPILDKFIWRYISEPDLLLVLTRGSISDILILFVEKWKYHLCLRRKKPIIDKINKYTQTEVKIYPIKKSLLKGIKNKYVDIRFTSKRQLDKKLLKLVRVYEIPHVVI